MSALWSHTYTEACPSYRQDPIQFSPTFCRVSLTVSTVSKWERSRYKNKAKAERITPALLTSPQSRTAPFRAQHVNC